MPKKKLSDKSNNEKIEYVSTLYFGVADTPTFDINPFKKIEDFLAAKVGDLKWPSNPDRAQAEKRLFSSLLSRTLETVSDARLDKADVEASLLNKTSNGDVVAEWNKKLKFV